MWQPVQNTATSLQNVCQTTVHSLEVKLFIVENYKQISFETASGVSFEIKLFCGGILFSDISDFIFTLAHLIPVCMPYQMLLLLITSDTSGYVTLACLIPVFYQSRAIGNVPLKFVVFKCFIFRKNSHQRGYKVLFLEEVLL